MSRPPQGGRRRPASAWAGLFFCALALGCAGGPRREAGKGLPRLALLPLANQSVDLEAPEKLRSALGKALAERGYLLASSGEVDAALKELGFTSGDQLGALDLSKLQARLPADWYVYGTVEEFVFKSAVALSQKKVALRLRVVDAASGRAVFEDAEAGVTSSAGAQAAGDLALHVVGKVAKAVKDEAKQVLPGRGLKDAADASDKVADVDMTEETRQALRKLLDKLDQVEFKAR